MTGNTGKFELTGTNGAKARVNWSEQYDAQKNASNLQIELFIKDTKYYGRVYFLNGPVSVDENAVITFDSVKGTHSVYTAKLDTYYAVNAEGNNTAQPWQSGEIAHDADGSKTVTIAVDITGFSDYGNFTISGEKTVDLFKIPRESTIGAADANIGAKTTIVIDRKSEDYKHSVKYEFGALSGYVKPDGGISTEEVKFTKTSVAWTVSTDFYQQIPDSKSGVCKLTVTTYSGDQVIGTPQSGTFTATAANSAPIVSGAIVDVNEETIALTGDENTLIRYASTAQCTITASPRNGASITQRKIAGITVPDDAVLIPEIEAESVKFYAKDSRGYSTTKTISPEMVPYIRLTGVAAVVRTDATSGNARLTVSGNYYDGSFGAENNELTVKYRVKQSGSDYGSYLNASVVLDDDSYEATADLSGLNYKKTYTVQVVISDKITTITKTVPVGRGLPAWDMGQNHFRVNAPLRLSEENYGEALPEEAQKGQLFFLITDSGIVPRIYDGYSWS